MDLDEERKNLPIYTIKNKLIAEIQLNPTLILLGETGSGKFLLKKNIIQKQNLINLIYQVRRHKSLSIFTKKFDRMA
jgi:HrpA-like RNA helicase